MFTNFLKGYLSRAQIREYLGFVLESGADSIIETPDGTYLDDPVAERAGAAISSVKEFHLQRSLGELPKLSQGGCVLISEGGAPSAPQGAVVVGVFYMSKLGRDYNGEPDTYLGENFQGDIGDVCWVTSSDWKDVVLAGADSGVNHRLVVFWVRA